MIALEPRTYELLAYLLEHRTDAVSKDELQERVWGTIVSESAVARSVMKLRKALDDSNEAIIKTVPRFGYKFNAIVVRESGSADSEVAIEQSARRPGMIAIAAVLFLFAIVTFAWFVVDDWLSGPASAKSVAVLPFDDMSEAQDQAWFADGLAEELLNALTRTPDLLVASRTSSFAYRDSSKDIRDIAAELGVAHIVEGSVRRDNNQLRVTAQLIRAADGFHLWSETYDHQFDDLIVAQEQIAIDIANAMETAMDPESLARMLATGTRSVSAFEAYIQGLSDHTVMATTGNTKEYIASIEAFERAAQLDPEFSAAHEEIAEYWSTQLSMIGIASNPLDMPRHEARRRFEAAIDRAIETAGDETRRLTLLSNKAFLSLRVLEAYKYNVEFLEQRPNDWAAQNRQISILSSLGRYDELIDTLGHFFSDSLVNPVVLSRGLHASLYTGNREAIEEFLNIALTRIDSSEVINYQVLRSLLWLGRHDEAEMSLQRVLVSELPEENKYLAALRFACATGNTEQARLLIDENFDRYKTDVAIVWLSHIIMGENDAAAESLIHFDDEDITAYGAFLEYGAFDASRYPNLSNFLEVHSEVRPSPVDTPYRCNN